MKIIGGMIIILIIEALVALGIIYSGHYNVSALHPDSGVVFWVLDTTRERSVKAHAAKVQVPVNFAALSSKKGFVHYNSMCIICHGAPGVKASEINKGLNPRPPDLREAGAEGAPNELFWIVKNGIKMTGMPAFGPTHTDEQIWFIVAFLKKLPGISAQQYRAMAKKAAGHQMEM